MVIWIIGRSGSGKTFFSKKLYNYFYKKKINCFLVDGDEVRKYLNYKLKYTQKDRKINSQKIQDLCLYLEKKRYLVICSIQSIFKDHQLKNKKKFKLYKQIYLKVDEKIFNKRKSKLAKFKKNVVGKDIKFPEPYKSDLTILNDFKNYNTKLKKIINFLK